MKREDQAGEPASFGGFSCSNGEMSAAQGGMMEHEENDVRFLTF